MPSAAIFLERSLENLVGHRTAMSIGAILIGVNSQALNHGPTHRILTDLIYNGPVIDRIIGETEKVILGELRRSICKAYFKYYSYNEFADLWPQFQHTCP